MFTSSREQLEQFSGQTGFRPETLEKVIRLGALLKDINRHPLLSNALVLKGGTALNLFFGSPMRLSVDLDFNYIGDSSRERMLEDRPKVERAIITIAQGQNYQVQASKESHAGRKLYLSYINTMRTRDRVEVDLNYVFRVALGPVLEHPMWQPGDLDRPMAKIVPYEELYSGKACALLERTLPRDLFDTIYLSQHDNGIWQTAHFKKVFIAFAGVLPHPLSTYDERRFERITETFVKQQLNPMLTPEARTNADKLKVDAWTAIKPLLHLNDAEREYIERIHKGELKPELLFPEDEEFSRLVAAHPALHWKVENVRKHRG